MKIHLIAAARPNFMKIAPLYHELVRHKELEPLIIHTGQHYDLNMSDVFFKDFNLPEPHIHLGVGSGSHAVQTGQVMMAYEKILMEYRPDLVVVVGDVNSTMAVTIACAKLGVKVAHLEAGLRSYDRAMPEEINRVVTDALADYLWTPSPDGNENLEKEGVSPNKITMVGNIMIDSLEMLREKIQNVDTAGSLGLKSGGYGLVTLHRPSNVDDAETLADLCRCLVRISQKLPLVFPVHPRTQERMKTFGVKLLLESAPGVVQTEPMGYKAFMNLVMNARVLITDSGGIQEESTYLKIPCLTLRENTERPVTITQGTNTLCRPEDLDSAVDDVLARRFKAGRIPDLWDGRTAGRVAEFILTQVRSDLSKKEA